MCQTPTNIILKLLLMLCKHQIAEKIKVKARKRWCRCPLNSLNPALGMSKLVIIVRDLAYAVELGLKIETRLILRKRP